MTDGINQERTDRLRDANSEANARYRRWDKAMSLWESMQSSLTTILERIESKIDALH